jgi:activating signal cointegrator 1
MRCLSLTQPWASLVACSLKRIETRSWPTSYRGPLAIHAAKGYPVAARAFFHDTIAGELLRQHGITSPPRGAVIAVCGLVHVGAIYRLPDEVRIKSVEWTVQPREVGFGDYTPGRYAWLLADVQALPEPIPARGSLGLWEWAPPAGWELSR